MNKLKINDKVIVTAGRDKGKIGSLKKIDTVKNQVVVEGVNIVKKALKPTQENPNGGFIDTEKPFNISNVQLYSDKKSSASRVGVKRVDGKNVRFLKKCGTILA